MELNYVAFAIPAFFLFAGLEYLAAVRKNKQHYFSFDGSIANISIGVAERLMNLFVTASFYSAFWYVYNNWSLFNIPNHWTVWVLLILMTDLVWYWYHRLGHEINILWGAHIVHHQSEEFNYTVSARITVFQAFARNIFWCILPLLGFHPAMVITMLVIHGTYSFFTHTRIVGKLGWLEYVLITPSHHRVHHASNEEYLNKNYGDIFIFWDKLFGTFQKEDAEPAYGLTHPIKSYSFMWQHFHYFMEMAEGFRRAKGLKEKWRVVFGRPEDLDQNIRPGLEKKFLPHKGRVKSTRGFRGYVNGQMIASLLMLFFLVLLVRNFDGYEKLFMSMLIVITMVNCGALLEQRTWIYHLEYVRVILITGLVSYEFGSIELFTVSLVFLLVTLTSLPLERWYLKLLYDTGSQKQQA